MHLRASPSEHSSPSRKTRAAVRLLDAAGELMIERDSIDISLSDIAKKSGLNSALVKYHFGNKDGLLLALVKRAAGAEIDALKSLMEQPLSATVKLKVHIAGIIKAYQRYPYLNRLLHHLMNEEEGATEISGFFVTPLLEFHRALLAQGVAAGEFQPVDPVLFFTSLFGACDHLFYGRRFLSRAAGVGPITDDVCRQYIAHVQHFILGGLTTGGGSNGGANAPGGTPL